MDRLQDLRPSPAPLRRAGRRQELAARSLRALAGAVLVATVAISAAASPAPALHGRGLAVSIALVALAAGIVGLIAPASAAARRVAWAVVAILACAAITWLQPEGSSAPGVFLAVGVVAMRSEIGVSLPTLALALAALAVAGAHSHRGAAATLSLALGAVAFYAVALFARRAQEAREEAERLMVELDATREAQAEAAAMRERSRLARDMHDILAHSLSGLMLQLEGARMLAERPDADGRLPAVLERAHRLASGGLREARHAIAMLRDEELPGPDRLGELASEFEQDSRIAARVQVSGAPRALGAEARLTIYRAAQEALTNTRRHARARRVELSLAYEREGTRLVVEDHADGRPDSARPAAQPNGQGYGLTGMRERAELLGGSLSAAPTGDGFRVELWVPA
ncbi:MAG TPA: sensor histidine kinase [Solirubrobacteraceae bacterium]|nr:sensor histidine kinase [Solirubrobacteraceae bacterium]HYM67887.1 sensor histidine kinase [Patescibacteria group bacterium]